MQIDVLSTAHDVSGCSTGEADLDHYLQHLALHEQARGLATVYVAVQPRGAVAGFFTLSPLSLRLDKLVGSLPVLAGTPYPQVGGYLLGRLGVHGPLQATGISGALVARAAEIATVQSGATGGAFLAVDPKHGSDAHGRDLVDYYARFGFVFLDPNRVQRRMVRALK